MVGTGAAGLACSGSHPCSVTVRMARPLEQAVAAIVGTFREYAGRRGDRHRLCSAELKELLQKELPAWTPVSACGPPCGDASGTRSERRTAARGPARPRERALGPT